LNIPEFHIGDCVTFWPEDHGKNMVVIDLAVIDACVTYTLMEEPEGKPLAQHLQVTATGADILQSDLFKNKRRPTICPVEKPI
jgi:hypothetical protein